jgi:hypothetical protein
MKCYLFIKILFFRPFLDYSWVIIKRSIIYVKYVFINLFLTFVLFQIMNSANKLFRPWVTCRCVDCSLNIDSKRLICVLKMALSENQNNNNNNNNNNENRNIFRRNSAEDSSDNRSEANSSTTETTIVYSYWSVSLNFKLN